MIRFPDRGDTVQVWYGAKVRQKARAASIPHHARTGVIEIVARGPGPRNVGVRIGGEVVVVPRGNLREPATPGMATDVERQGKLWV